MTDKSESEVKDESVVEEKEEKEEKEEQEEETEAELPAEVDAFLKGKNKYKHPYGPWRPAVKVEPLKRKTFGDQLDLPADNWHLPENQTAPVIIDTKDDSQVKLVFKEKEITSSTPSSSSSTEATGKSNNTVTFKKRKSAPNRQLRGANSKDD